MKRGSTTRQQAINLKCKDCIYDPLSGLGTWVQQAEGCTATDCPLYAYRPRSRSDRLSKVDSDLIPHA